GLPERGDVSDWLNADRRNADKLADICFDTPVWQPSASADTSADTDIGPTENNAPGTVLEAWLANNNTKETEKPPPKLAVIDIGKWHESPPAREWSTPERFPLRQVCLFSGEGAVGKSIVSLQLCTAHVLGKDWLRALPEPGPAIYVGAEDDATELWRRMT